MRPSVQCLLVSLLDTANDSELRTFCAFEMVKAQARFLIGREIALGSTFVILHLQLVHGCLTKYDQSVSCRSHQGESP